MIDDDEDLPDGEEDALEREPKSAAGWLSRIKSAERAFDTYQDKCDRIDQLFGTLERLSNSVRDREFQLFWSNMQVMGPATYARPPKPVVTPKFADRRPVYRVASEFLERCASVSFDLSDINSVMLQVRDDLNIAARGAPWVRYESKADADGPTEAICIEHVDRRDFLHEPARKWAEVDWVAKRSWLTRREMRKRFRKTSGDAYQTADFSVQSEDRERGAASHASKAGVWEIWCKSEKRVIWVAPGCEKLLDDDKPHLSVSGFFPCPQPAYATVQRRSLVPIPDVLFYQDQLDEISDLTARIHALGRALQVKGFYQGGGEIGSAIETAMAVEDPGKMLVPVSSMAAFGGGGEPIMWLPVDMIAQTILSCVELRRQLIDDVYQIIGLSDIQRGSTEAQETLGAQQLKNQNGSARVRDKQNELVRVARDLVRIASEVMVDQFDRKTLIVMAQMDIPTDSEQKKQVEDLKRQAKEAFESQMQQAMANPEAAQMPPEAQQQAIQQLQQQIMAEIGPQIDTIEKTPTIDEVMEFLKDNKLRPFVLDIETDSTVFPDEMAEKQSRAEFLGAFSTAAAAITPLLAAGAPGAKLAGGMIKFALGPYRVGRELEGMVDDFVDAAPQMAEAMAGGQDDGGLAEAQKALADAEMLKAQAQQAKVEADMQGKMQDLQLKTAQAQMKAQDDQRKGEIEVAKVRAQLDETKAKIEKVYAEIEKIRAETPVAAAKVGIDAQRLQLDAAKAAGDAESRRMEQDRAERQGAQDAMMQERQQSHSEETTARNMDFTERNAQEEREFKAQTMKPKGGSDG